MRRLAWMIPFALLAACSGESFHGDSQSQLNDGNAGVGDLGVGGRQSAAAGSVGEAGAVGAGAPSSDFGKFFLSLAASGGAARKVTPHSPRRW